jgi:hypothetical protein
MVDGRMKNTAARLGLRIAVVATAVTLATSLTGCIQSNTPLPGSSKPSTAAPVQSNSPTPGPTPTPTSTATTFTENCDILLTSAQIYAYNPNFVSDNTYVPQAGSIPAKIGANGGTTCGWLNETSGSFVEVAIATPLPADLAAAKSAASSGAPISANGEQGFFAVKNGVGSAQFFFGTFWLDVSSKDFEVASDAQAIYPIVVQNQLSAGG